MAYLAERRYSTADSSLSQLCCGCQSIFCEKIQLTYGTFYRLPHGALSKEQPSCHLCNIVDMAWRRLNRKRHLHEGRSWSTIDKRTVSYATPVQFALKVFNEEWARYGDGPMWPALDFNGDYEDHIEVSRASRKAQTDPTDYGLSKLLTTDAEDLTDGSIEFWLCMVFADYLRNSIVLPLEIHTVDEAEAIAQINLQHQVSTGTPENMRLAKHWLHNCLQNHTRCLYPARAHAQSTAWLPTRLLYIGSEPHFPLRLVSTAEHELSRVSYAALSYRWSDQSQFCLTSTKLQQYHQSITFSELSKTLQEAVKTCQSLDLEYLWVDALCIVQDDINDWSRESAVMSKVYGFATCTIAAADSGEDEGGCFATRNQYQVRPCSIPNPLNPFSSKHRFYIRPQFLKDIFEQEVRQSEWYARGWVFQERMLSSRLLIFGKTQMLWACQEIQAAESWPSGKTSENFIDQFESFEVEKARLEKLLDPSRHVAEMNDLWAVLLADYAASTNNFTRMSDRLIALQGLAFQIQESTRRGYCAGLWLGDSLPVSLLWIALDPTTKRPSDRRAPSWSWASLDCGIEFNIGRFKGITAIRYVRIPDAEKDLTDYYYHEGILTPRLQASGHVLRVSVTEGPGLAVYDCQPRLPRAQDDMAETSRQTSTQFQNACKHIWHKLKSTIEEMIRKIQLGTMEFTRKLQFIVKTTIGQMQTTAATITSKMHWQIAAVEVEKTMRSVFRKTRAISRKCLSILDHASISSASRWAKDTLIPLGLGFLLVVLCSPLLVSLSFWKGISWVKKARCRARRRKMVPSVDNSKDPDLHATCFFDSAPPPLGTAEQQPTFIIPMLDGYRTSGLIVQLVETPEMPKDGGDADGYMYHYKRLGVFEMNSLDLGKFRITGSDRSGNGLVEQNFYLV